MLLFDLKQFLIIQTAFIGDVILATSLVEKLQTHYPDASIDFLLRKGNESLLLNHPKIRKTLIWDKKNAKYTSLFSLAREVRHQKYDYVINLQRFGATGILTGFSGARNKIGFVKNPFSFLFTKKVVHKIEEGIHEIDRNHELIKDMTDELPAKPKLYPTTDDFENVKDFTDAPFVTIAPSSVWFTKQLPASKWIELINTLDKDIEIYFLGASDDSALAEEIQSKCRSYRTINLCGKLNLLSSAALMSRAQHNYVNDSAPLHLASAMNAPVSAIYCSTIPAFGFGPLSDDSNIIEINYSLSCRPCGLHGKKSCPEGHFKCANDIQFKPNSNPT